MKKGIMAQKQFDTVKLLLPKYNLSLKKGVAVYTGTGDSLIYYFNESSVPLIIRLTTQTEKNLIKKLDFYKKVNFS